MIRKYIILFFIFSGFFSNCLHSQQPSKTDKTEISALLVKEFIDFLASDELRGRPAPSKEADKSADYIASKLKEYGIQPFEGSYVQPIPFCAKDLDIKNCKFIITKSGAVHTFSLKNNFTPLFNTSDDSIKGELVFAGYGITAPEYDYDDYEHIDVEGKIVLVLKQEPRKNDTISTFFEGSKHTQYSDIAYKIRNAAAHGAKGFLLVTDPLHNIAITAQGYLWNSLYIKDKKNLIYNLCEETGNIPAVQVDQHVINTFFGSVDSLRALQREIDEQLAPASFTLPEMVVELTVAIDKKEMSSSNVFGYVEGNHPQLKNEFVVIGAHYDHIGVSPYPNHYNDSIMNGADDNASGTAAVMAVAKAFASSPEKPARSILFIFFTAEEQGLIGSYYYTNHPIVPLEKSVAMINMDMVGRNGNDTVYIIGQQYNPELSALVNTIIPEVGLMKMEMGMEKDLYRSSDYYPFYKKGISAIGITSGLHTDYHTVGDDPEKINHQKVKKTAQLVFKTAWEIANNNNYYKINDSDKIN